MIKSISKILMFLMVFSLFVGFTMNTVSATETTTNPEVFVKEYQEVVVDGDKMFLIVFENEEMVLTKTLVEENGQITYESDGKEVKTSFSQVDKSRLNALIEKFEFYVKISSVNTILIPTVFLLLLIWKIFSKSKKSEYIIVGIAISLLVLFTGLFSHVDKLHTKVLEEAVAIYAQQNNQEYPIDENKKTSGDTSLIYGINKEALVEHVDYRIISLDTNGVYVDTENGDIYRHSKNKSAK